ncbi:hypothetical protein Y695_04606 [Hydrogenophaga sp. T4]|nr:hypothetical protein Y695_04606 [Hydrogenophaga sp. T4]
MPPDAARSLQAAGEFVDAIDGFVLVIEKQLSGYTAILNLFQFVMMALAIGSAVIMLYTGYLYVINPLAHLRRCWRGSRRASSAPASTSTRRTNLARWPPVSTAWPAPCSRFTKGWRPRCRPRRSASRRSAPGWKRCTR